MRCGQSVGDEVPLVQVGAADRALLGGVGRRTQQEVTSAVLTDRQLITAAPVAAQGRGFVGLGSRRHEVVAEASVAGVGEGLVAGDLPWRGELAVIAPHLHPRGAPPVRVRRPAVGRLPVDGAAHMVGPDGGVRAGPHAKAAQLGALGISDRCADLVEVDVVAQVWQGAGGGHGSEREEAGRSETRDAENGFAGHVRNFTQRARSSTVPAPSTSAKSRQARTWSVAF